MSSHSIHTPRKPAERNKAFCLLLMAVITVAVGTWGLLAESIDKHPPAHAGEWVHEFFKSVYHGLQMLVLHTPHLENQPWQVTIAEWLGAAFFGFAVVIPVLQFLWREMHQRQILAQGGHVIICGHGETALALAHAYVEDKSPVIVLSENADEGWVSMCEHAGAEVVVDDPSQPSALKSVALDKARCVIIAESSDRLNIRVALNVQQRLKQVMDKPVCHVRLENMDLRGVLQQSHLLDGGDASSALLFFDEYDAEALDLLQNRIPPDRGMIRCDGTGADLVAHLVILGFGHMGRSLAVRAAQMCHFANGKKLRLSIIDGQARRAREELLFRHQAFETVVDATFVEQPLVSPSTLNQITNWCAEPGHIVSIVTCFEDDALSLELALQLRQVLEQTQTPLVLRMGSETKLRDLLENEARRVRQSLNKKDTTQANAFGLYTFGPHEGKRMKHLLESQPADHLPRALHEQYLHVALSAENPEQKKGPNLLPWDQLYEDFRNSNRQLANHIDVKLRAAGCIRVPVSDPRRAVMEFEPEVVTTLSMMEHERWMAERLLAGWTYATRETENKALKQNHTLVPWDKLTDEEKEYDIDFVKKLPSLLNGIREKIVKKD